MWMPLRVIFRGRYGIPIENMIVLAHSLAAVTVAAWVHDYAPPIRAMILATAAFHVKLYVPVRDSGAANEKSCSARFVKSYVKSKILTHDREQAARYDSDPLIFRQIAVNVFLELQRYSKPVACRCRCDSNADADDWCGKDWVVSLKAQHEFFDRLSSPLKELRDFPATLITPFFTKQDRHLVVHRVA